MAAPLCYPVGPSGGSGGARGVEAALELGQQADGRLVDVALDRNLGLHQPENPAVLAAQLDQRVEPLQPRVVRRENLAGPTRTVDLAAGHAQYPADVVCDHSVEIESLALGNR